MKKITSWCALMLAAFLTFASFGAMAGPAQQSVRPDDKGSFQVAAWNDRVCCKRGWQDWWTTRRACKRAGGYPTANRQCRNDWNDQWDFRWFSWNGGNWNNRVCCKRGNRDWWTTALECRNSFGYQTANRECRNDIGEGNRICCKRGWQDWWTTRRACNNAGGYQTANRECRSDWNDRWDNRWWGWEGGNWNNRVCCKKGNRDWWTTALDCRNSFGWQTSNHECRNDNNNGNWNNGGGGNWNNNNNNGNWNDDWDDRWRPWQGDWNSRICCKKGYRDWWSTAFECRAAGGYQTLNQACRND
jgi:hypothetical protein